MASSPDDLRRIARSLIAAADAWERSELEAYQADGAVTEIDGKSLGLLAVEGAKHWSWRPHPETIIAVSASQYGVKPDDITGRRRFFAFMEPRQVAMYVARELCEMSFPQLGEVFERDHTTVLHAWQQIGEKLLWDRTLSERVLGLIEQLDLVGCRRAETGRPERPEWELLSA